MEIFSYLLLHNNPAGKPLRTVSRCFFTTESDSDLSNGVKRFCKKSYVYTRTQRQNDYNYRREAYRVEDQQLWDSDINFIRWQRPAIGRLPNNNNNNNNNNIYFAKGQLHQKGKSPSKLATILRDTKEKKTKNRKEKFFRYKHLNKPVSTMSSSLYTYHIITKAVCYA